MEFTAKSRDGRPHASVLGMGKKSVLRGLVLAATIVVPGVALAHTVLVSPPPRDVGVSGNDGHKIGSAPCGNVARTGKYVQMEAGASVEVQWKETVDHVGCFQIAISTDDDKTFKVLKQINDEAGTVVPAMYKDTITLPAGMTCKNCTLQLRQLMQSANVPCTPDADPTMAVNGTYFSCADICVGTDCPPIVAEDPEAGTTSSSTSSGATGTSSGDNNDDPEEPSSGGRAANTLGGNNGGCSTTSGLTSGAVFSAAVAMLGLTVARRRRSKKS